MRSGGRVPTTYLAPSARLTGEGALLGCLGRNAFTRGTFGRHDEGQMVRLPLSLPLRRTMRAKGFRRWQSSLSDRAEYTQQSLAPRHMLPHLEALDLVNRDRQWTCSWRWGRIPWQLGMRLRMPKSLYRSFKNTPKMVHL